MIVGPPEPPPISRIAPFLSNTNDGDIDDNGRLKGCTQKIGRKFNVI